MSMKRDAFAVSTAVGAMTEVMVVLLVVAMVVMVVMVVMTAAAHAAPTRKAGDETKTADNKAAETKPADATGDGTGKAGDSGRPACMHCGATCGLTPVCVCERGTKKKTRIEFESRCEPVCIAGCGGSVPRVCCTDCRAEPCACPGRVRICNRLRAETVTDEVPAVVRTVRYVCRCCEATCDGPPRHPHRWPWASLAGWFRGWPVPWMRGR